MEIKLSNKFLKQVRKLVENKPNLKVKINQAIIDFAEHKRQATCFRKKLKGQWHGYEELEIGGDMRMIIRVNKEQTRAIFERIGTHSQLGL